MNRKGYTLIEIIGAVIILGIIAIIAVATFTRNLRGFRDEFYASQESTLVESGREFLSDNRNLRPSDLLEGQKVKINLLESSKYVDSIKDYNGDDCEGYVLVVKENKNDYTYHACLKCPYDNYVSPDPYCDDSIAWEITSSIEYDLGDTDTIYIYKGTSREELKNLLYLGVKYIRTNGNGDKVVISKDEDGDSLKVLPQDIDKVNPEKVGEYEVTYEYNGTERKRTVVIYENEYPSYIIKKKNEVAIDLNGGKTTEETNYTSGEWAQELLITFTQSKFQNEESKISSYQWNKDGRWQDLCKPNIDNCWTTDTTCSCTASITSEMNQDSVKFRTVDSFGKISKETQGLTVKIDNSDPVCTISTTEPADGEDGWFKKNVTVQIKNYDDKGLIPETKSGLKLHQVLTSGINRTGANSESQTQTANTSGQVYVGYVEDNAENYGTCKITIKKDDKKPECNITLSGTKNSTTGAYLTNVTATLTATDEGGSELSQYGIGSLTGNKEQTYSSSATVTGNAKDKAGNTNTCSTSFTINPNVEVTYNVNGGDAWTSTTCGSGYTLSGTTCKKNAAYNGTYQSHPTPVRKGYIFDGWYTAASGGTKVESTTKVTSTGSHTLYAHWTAKTVTVTFNCNGGSGGGTQTFTYGVANQKFSKTCTRANYTLAGWKLNSTATNKDYDVASGVSDDWINGHSPSVTIYAHWQGSTLIQRIKADNPDRGTITDAQARTCFSGTAGLWKTTRTTGGTTYVYRGNVSNNYVKFANRIWRIVRINEDGTSVRLVLNTSIGTSKYNNASTTALNMYYSRSALKSTVDTWYNNNLKASYQGKLVGGNKFCQKANVTKYYGSGALNFYKTFFYANNSTNMPYCEGCVIGDTKALGSFTKYTTTFACGADVSGYSTINSYIGLLTFEDIAFSGGKGEASCTTTWIGDGINNGDSYWATMSPAGYGPHDMQPQRDAFIWGFNARSKEMVHRQTNTTFYIYPVVNILGSVTVTGSGTSSNPYVVQ